ncbi:MAG: beta-lactamase family protein [Acidobacteria bacterium]|nr:beta-lactamase family protein [Acidobacteriota bacterium]
MVSLMTKYRLPGGALAVTDGGRLVLAHGYGFADREARIAAEPFHLFRVASLSKTITAVGTLKLVQEGKLGLDDRLLTILPDLQPAPGRQLDARYRNVTVRQLLHHTFGSDSSRRAQTAFSNAAPTIANMVRYGLGLPLHFDPGTSFAYSNLGYHFLGRIIEKASGKTYETYVRDEILAPLGISAMRIGRTLASQRFPDEVKYYDHAAATAGPSLIAGVSGPVPRPYGASMIVEIAESYGGWVASAVDLARYVTGLNGRRRAPSLLSPDTLNLMFARPPAPVSQTTSAYYALGWNARPAAGRFSYWHSGSLPGTRTYLVTFANGRSYAAVFNMRPP